MIHHRVLSRVTLNANTKRAVIIPLVKQAEKKLINTIEWDCCPCCHTKEDRRLRIGTATFCDDGTLYAIAVQVCGECSEYFFIIDNQYPVFK